MMLGCRIDVGESNPPSLRGEKGITTQGCAQLDTGEKETRYLKLSGGGAAAPE